jgi:hypothetical protein
MLGQDFIYFIRRYCRPLPISAGVIALAIFLWTLRATGAQNAVPPQPKTVAKLDTASLAVAPNLSAQLAKFNPVRMLVERGDLPKDKLRVYYASEVAGIFHTVRFGVAEAHGRAEIMEFNFFSERGVINLNHMPAIARAPKRGLRSTVRCRPRSRKPLSCFRCAHGYRSDLSVPRTHALEIRFRHERKAD